MAMSLQTLYRTGAAVVALALLAGALLGPRGEAADDAAWSHSGPTGPANWGGVCATGQQQSPVDLSAAVPAQVTPPRLDWRPAQSAEVINNGHTIQVNLTGAGGLWLGEKPYELLQFHFHHGSEHTVAGRQFPLEGHFVHRAADGTLAVVGVFFTEGAENFALTPIWEGASPTPGAAAPILAQVRPEDFLPRDQTAFHYAGSLTTPPCTENVTWTVFAEPVEAGRDQLAAFAAAFPGGNYRPVQPRHRRFVLATE